MLIAESGATKTEWRLCEGGEVKKSFRSQGFSPSTMSEEAMRAGLKELVEAHGLQNEAELYFYSTGAGHPLRKQQLEDQLHRAFPQATIEVQSDLMAAVRATQHKVGMVAIMGTGSNLALFRDGEITHTRGGLGYLLGDEGAGADLGKWYLKNLLEGSWPPEYRTRFEAEFETSVEQWMRLMYKAPKPHVKLASLAPHIAKWKAEYLVHQLIKERFIVFLKGTASTFQTREQEAFAIDVVGSIGHHFFSIFQEACSELRLTAGRSIPAPIDELVIFHAK